MQPNLSRQNVAHSSPTVAVDTAIDDGLLFDAEARIAQCIPEEVARVPGRGQRKLSALLWRTTLLAGDTLLVVALLVLLIWLAQHSVMGFPVWNAKLSWIVLALFSWSVALNLTRAQEMVYAANRFTSVLRSLLALVVMLALWSGLSWLYFGSAVTRSLWLEGFFFALSLLLLFLWRLLLFELMRLPPFRQRTVIIGVNAAGEAVSEALQCVRRPVMRLLGYINERSDLLELPLSKDAPMSQRLAPASDGVSVLRALINSNRIDTIIVAFDNVVNPALYQEAIAAAQAGIAVLPMAVAYERLTGRIPVQHIGDQWYGVLPLERTLAPLYLFWRKIIDIGFGVLGAAALLLLLPVIALLLYLDSPGSIFYTQERVGLWGKPFRIFKFRSMRVDAEGEGVARYALANDARVTRIGRFLRATHLDELPQVFNILRGDMSVIGPRPERRMFVEELEQSIPLYRFRLSVKPGLTGWAQVKYSYASSTEDALYKLQYDLYYIKHRSLTLDIFILLKTVGEVLLSRGR